MKITFHIPQMKCLKSSERFTQIWCFVLEGFCLFRGCVGWASYKNQECKANSTERTESLPPALLAGIRVHPPQAFSDVKVSTCISGAGSFLYTSFSATHRRLYIVHGIKLRVCTSRKSSFEGKKTNLREIY